MFKNLITKLVVATPLQQTTGDIMSSFHESTISKQEVFNVGVNTIAIMFQLINQLLWRSLQMQASKSIWQHSIAASNINNTLGPNFVVY